MAAVDVDWRLEIQPYCSVHKACELPVENIEKNLATGKVTLPVIDTNTFERCLSSYGCRAISLYVFIE